MSRYWSKATAFSIGAILAATSISCSRNAAGRAGEAEQEVVVGVTTVRRMPLERRLTLSSELVPFQEIDVYAKESGYVRELKVDYGTRVKKGQLLAVLEIPELEAQLRQDDAAIKSMTEQVTHAEHELSRVKAQHNVIHLQSKRLTAVAESKPGLVAQQEVDDAQGKDLAAEDAVESAQSALESVQSQVTLAQAKLVHDQAIYDYSRITAPFDGVITQRYANLGTLVQAGTNSTTNVLPLVKLSEDDLFRLVIPVPESYVRNIRIGDPIAVRVPALNRNLPGKVARFSVDVKEDTRNMHTEVDVPNPGRALIPGMYAEATLVLEKKDNAVAVPLQAVSHESGNPSLFIVNSDSKIEIRPVTLGLETADNIEVLSGAADGDRVVVSERSGLKPGASVHVQLVQVPHYEAPE
jgi:RND family efflux transporter MFP subunit